jgi:hypothetical protein
LDRLGSKMGLHSERARSLFSSGESSSESCDVQLVLKNHGNLQSHLVQIRSAFSRYCARPFPAAAPGALMTFETTASKNPAKTASTPPVPRLKRFVQALILLVISCTAGLALLEVSSRWILPITLRPDYLSLDGKPVKVVESPVTLTFGLVFRQVATEFDAYTTITPQGHRMPQVNGNPEIVFIGDSFTFGWGIADKDTFVYRFADATGKSCANLGRPNTGTGRQVRILEHFLEKEHWHPQRVKLFMYVTSSILIPGIDFYDDLQDATAVPKQPKEPVGRTDSSSLYERIFELRKLRIEDSNLVRVAKYNWSPWLRSRLYPAPHLEQLRLAMETTRGHLNRLEELSHEYGFSYEIYIVHPMQEIINHTHQDTVNAVRKLAPGIQIKDTAPLFLDEPLKYYFHYDAHLNPVGTAKIAAFMIAEESEVGSSMPTSSAFPK